MSADSMVLVVADAPVEVLSSTQPDTQLPTPQRTPPPAIRSKSSTPTADAAANVVAHEEPEEQPAAHLESPFAAGVRATPPKTPTLPADAAPPGSLRRISEERPRPREASRSQKRERSTSFTPTGVPRSPLLPTAMVVLNASPCHGHVPLKSGTPHPKLNVDGEESSSGQLPRVSPIQQQCSPTPARALTPTLTRGHDSITPDPVPSVDVLQMTSQPQAAHSDGNENSDHPSCADSHPTVDREEVSSHSLAT